jgi:NAD(P)-dependent dehydrogenase (short-subunit alcohol dehydrogenase family)
MSNQKVVLITGASSGVGQSTARLLSQKGYKVFGTSRNPSGAEAIPAVEMLALDVRSDASVSACVTAIVNQVGRVDVLVNNAAYELAGALEEISLEEASAARVNEYDPWRQRAFAAIRDREEKGPGPQLVAETILKIISSKTPRLHYLIGFQARFVSRLQWFLSEGAYERAKMGNFGLRK